MSLPQQGSAVDPQQMAIFDQMRQEISPKEFGDELLNSAMQADPETVKAFKDELMALEVPIDTLMLLNEMVDVILANPQDYPSLRREYLRRGVTEDVLPPTFDPAFFGALNMALDQMPVQQPQAPAQMAGGGIAQLAQYGRNGDTMLAHINPQEAAMLKRMGGAGTINPMTGLPEYGNIFSSIGKAVKKFASSTVGKIITTVALGFFLGPAAAGMLGVTSSAGVAAVSGFVGGAGSTLLAGGKLKDALKAGAIGGLTAGAGAAITGGASAFDSRVMGGANADWSGFGQPETLVQAPPPTDLAASITGTPEMQIGQYNAPSYNPLGIDVRPTPPAPLIDPRFGGEFVSQADRFGADIPLETGGLRPDELTGTVAKNTGPGTYKDGVFTARTAAQTSSIGDLGPIGNPNNLQAPIKPFDSLTSPSTQTSLLDKAKGLYQEYMPEALGGSRGAVTPDAISAKIPEATKLMSATYPDLASAPSGTTAANRFAELVGKKATELATPGMLSTYGPAAALALGATALAGGFKTEPAKMPLGKQETGFDYLNRYPERYKLEFGGISGARNPYNPYMSAPRGMADGGIAALEMGGTTYPRKTGHISGPGTGTSDSIPALLSDGEFVFTAKAVRAMGQGSRRKGAKKLYSMMKMLEKRQG